MAQHRQNS